MHLIFKVVFVGPGCLCFAQDPLDVFYALHHAVIVIVQVSIVHRYSLYSETTPSVRATLCYMGTNYQVFSALQERSSLRSNTASLALTATAI